VSERARHRADLPPSTPLKGLSTTINTAIGDNTAALSRTGMIVAVSSGLVAGVGLPAGAAVRAAAGGAPQTASVPLLTESASTTALAAGADVLASAPVSASAQAKVTFEHAAFTAQPKRSARTTAAPSTATRDVASVSRSLARRAYLASRPAAAPARRVSSGTHRASSSSPSAVPVPVLSSGRGATVIAIAMRYIGIPYVYGGASPRGFDCSGLTKYVFAQLGISLARSADAQYRSVPRIPRSQAEPGDLVFYLSGGGAYHVGIYVGGNKMIAAPHTGLRVRVQPIYSSNIAFARP
jgi:cell wall-associated NlpC family hydrolase